MLRAVISGLFLWVSALSAAGLDPGRWPWCKQPQKPKERAARQEVSVAYKELRRGRGESAMWCGDLIPRNLPVLPLVQIRAYSWLLQREKH